MSDADPGGPLIYSFMLILRPLITGTLSTLFLAFYYALTNAFEAIVPALELDELEPLAEQDDSMARFLLRIKKDQRAFVWRVRCLKILVLVYLTYSTTVNCTWILNELFPNLGEEWKSLIVFLILTFFAGILLGFLTEVPARLARRKALSFAKAFWLPYRVGEILTWPISSLTYSISQAALRRRGMDPEAEDILISEEALRELLEKSSQGGKIKNEEQALIENVFAFGDKSVGETMTHRVDMLALDLDCELDEVIRLIKEEKYSRMPVYETDIDHILGLVNARDILLEVAENGSESFHLSKMMRDVSFTPETANVSTVFKQMQREHNHMTIVIDEYGGTAGLVTMEDLLEEIVGNIQDEYDEEKPEIQVLNPQCWLLDGTCSLELLQKASGVTLPVEDFDTVAGFILELLDRIPDPDEHATVQYDCLDFRVESMEERRIAEVKVCLDRERQVAAIKHAEGEESDE